MFNDYLDTFKILRQNSINSISYLTYVSKSENIIMAVQRKAKYDIIKLLYRKNMDLFRKISVKDYPQKFLKKINDKTVYTLFSDTLQQNNIYIEHREEFLTYIFRKNADFRGNILDLEKCKQKLQEIESEKNKISDNFFILS